MKRIIFVICWLSASAFVYGQAGNPPIPPKMIKGLQTVGISLDKAVITVCFNTGYKGVSVSVSDNYGREYRSTLNASAGEKIMVAVPRADTYIVRVADCEGRIIRELILYDDM